MRVDEALVVEMARRGVTCTFSTPSAEVMVVIAQSDIHGMTAYRTRHEHAAVGMADGYARASGKVGVAILGKGPGLTNGINALLTSAKSPTGIVVIAGERFSSAAADPRTKGGRHPSRKNVDQAGFLAALGVVTITLDSAESAVADLGAAFDLAANGITVVVLLCEDIGQMAAGAASSQVSLAISNPPATGGAAREDIELLADVLGESSAAARPVILAGRGAMRAGAKADLLRIGDSIGALFATSLLSNGLFANHPYELGVAGTLSSPLATEMLVRSDIVLTFGASLNVFQTFDGELFPSAHIVRVDSSEAAVKSGPRPAELAIVGDAGVVAKQLADELERRGLSRTGYRTPEIAKRIATEVEPAPAAGPPGAPLNPHLVAALVATALPSNRAVVFDNGGFMAYSAKHITASEPEGLFLTHDYSSVGAGQPIALGAAVARPDRTTVFVTGDGGFMATLADFDMAVRYKLPMIFVILNDGAFAAEAHHLHLLNLPDTIALYDNPPLDEVGRAVGYHGIAVHRIEDLKGLGERLAGLDGPIVIDCHVPIDPSPDYVGIAHRNHIAVTA